MTEHNSNINHEKESERVKKAYEQRTVSDTSSFVRYMVAEREKRMASIIRLFVKEIETAEILEIGAGGGANIDFLKNTGFNPRNIYANELLNERVEMLKKNHADIHILPGSALLLGEDKKFDVVFQSTVFTSILDGQIKKELAAKMLRLLKPDGIILWYDFRYNNPNNKNVKGIPVSEIEELFGKKRVLQTYKVTLAPPLGRRIGSLYKLFNVFPFLRTHTIAVIQ